MKRIVAIIREIIEEIAKDIDIYLTIQRYARASRVRKTNINKGL